MTGQSYQYGKNRKFCIPFAVIIHCETDSALLQAHISYCMNHCMVIYIRFRGNGNLEVVGSTFFLARIWGLDD